MGWRYHKSINFGIFRINFSKTGIGYSYGCKGYRKTKMANGRTRITYSIPNTGISYVTEQKKQKIPNINPNKLFVNIIAFIIAIVVGISSYGFINNLFNNISLSSISEKLNNNNVSDVAGSGTTYKTNSDEYINYIKNTAHNIIDNNPNCHIEYIVAAYYNFEVVIGFNNYIEEDSLKNISYEITSNMYQELKKNNYKGNGGFLDFNDVRFTFKGTKPNCMLPCDIQASYNIDVLEIAKYNSFQEYLDNQ